jgi:hypothetical protein
MAGIGMPEALYLQEFGSKVWDAFETPPYHVGSSLPGSPEFRRDFRDVDVRVLLDDEVYERMGLGDPLHPHQNAKWVALTMAFAALGRCMTGLPIDFQIQQVSYANKTYDCPRSALGIIPARLRKADHSGDTA